MSEKYIEMTEEQLQFVRGMLQIFKENGIVRKGNITDYKKEPALSSTKTTQTTKVVIEGNNNANVTMIHTGTGDNIQGKVVINGRELPKHYYDLNTYFSGKGGKDND